VSCDQDLAENEKKQNPAALIAAGFLEPNIRTII
jgi:hypothetical protein